VKIEFTPKATQKPSAITVYTLYEEFVANYDQDSPHVKKHPADSGFRYTEQLASPPDKFIPGTKKRWGSRIYYIVDDENGKFRDAYYRFCKKLLTKGKAQSIDSKIEQAAQTAAQAAEARALAR
jgi:hypothetical protein